MALTNKFPVDLKFPRFPRAIHSASDLHNELQDIHNGINFGLGSYFNAAIDRPTFPGAAANIPWGTAGGPGVLGAGVLNYVYRVREGMCRLDFSLAFGVGTVLGGAGAFELTMPVSLVPALANVLASSGTCTIFNAAGGGLFSGIAMIINVGGILYIQIHLPQLVVPGLLGLVVPAAWAAGDFISVSIDYPYVV